jgi:hypothetical protein
MTKIIAFFLLPLFVFFNNGVNPVLVGQNPKTPSDANTGTYKKMIVANGSVAVNLDFSSLAKTSGKNQKAAPNELFFEVERDSFFTVVAFNDELRGALPSAMRIMPHNLAALPTKLSESSQNLVLERTGWGEPYELVVSDGKTGFVFFYVEGFVYDYDSNEQSLKVQGGRLLLSREYAAALKLPTKSGAIVGEISFTAALRNRRRCLRFGAVRHN